MAWLLMPEPHYYVRLLVSCAAGCCGSRPRLHTQPPMRQKRCCTQANPFVEAAVPCCAVLCGVCVAPPHACCVGCCLQGGAGEGRHSCQRAHHTRPGGSGSVRAAAQPVPEDAAAEPTAAAVMGWLLRRQCVATSTCNWSSCYCLQWVCFRCLCRHCWNEAVSVSALWFGGVSDVLGLGVPLGAH